MQKRSLPGWVNSFFGDDFHSHTESKGQQDATAAVRLLFKHRPVLYVPWIAPYQPPWTLWNVTERYGTGWFGQLGKSLEFGRFLQFHGALWQAVKHGEILTVKARFFAQTSFLYPQDGAGKGNRTLIFSLGSWCSATELCPQMLFRVFIIR